MEKKEQFNKEGFSLVISNCNYHQIIEIPYVKRGTKKMSVGGKQTFLMAIDNFTTKFSNRDELLNFIRDNEMARIKTANNNQLKLSIEYSGTGEYGHFPLVFNDQKGLIDFIGDSDIKEFFPPDSKYVKEFQNTIVKYWLSGMYQAEYRMFMTDYSNKFFGADLINVLNELKRNNGMDKVREEDSVIGPTCHYHNLRGYFVTNNILEEILYKIYVTKIIPPQERHEYKGEINSETKEQIKLDIVKFPEKKAIIKEDFPYEQLTFEESLFYSGKAEGKTR